MDQLKLTDDEWKCYAEYFNSCDLEGNGRVALGRAADLFKTSGLSSELLSQTLHLSGADKMRHFGRPQFYIALRCIALIQAGVPHERLSSDNLRWQNFDKDLQLPKLGIKTSPKSERPPEAPTRTSFAPSHSQPPAVPPKFPVRRITIAGIDRPPVSTTSHTSVLQTQHSVIANVSSTVSSTKQSSVTQLSLSKSHAGWASFDDVVEEAQMHTNAPANSVHEDVPQQITKVHPAVKNQLATATDALGELSDENDAVVQHEESELLIDMDSAARVHQDAGKFDMDWCHFSETEQGTKVSVGQSAGHDAAYKMTSPLDKERMYDAMAFQRRKSEKNAGGSHKGADLSKVKATGSDRDSEDSDSDSDDSTETEGNADADEIDSIDDVYRMTQEQRDYYVDHFLTLLTDPNPKALLDASSARVFFQKSNLPLDDLRRIWELADADRDGALTLEEFCTAMHLVVLRRNGLEIPSRLELSKTPYTQLDAQAEQPDDRQPDDAYAASYSELDSEPIEQPTFVPLWPSVQHHGAQMEPELDFVDHTTRLVPDAPSDLHLAPESDNGAAVKGRDIATFKPPPLPPRKPPHVLSATASSANPKESAENQSSSVVTDEAGMNNEWLKTQISKLQETKTLLERINRELNAELQETMEQRIALEVQLEHIRWPSLI